MKATQKDFATGIPASADRALVFFFCGPDEAGAFASAALATEAMAPQ